MGSSADSGVDGAVPGGTRELTKDFDPSETPIVIDFFGSQFTDIPAARGDWSRNSARPEIVKALKGYSAWIRVRFNWLTFARG